MNVGGSKGRSLKMVTGMALGSIFLYSLSHSLMSVMVNEIVDGFSLSGASEGMMGSMFGIGAMAATLIAPLIQGRVAKLTAFLFATALQAVTLVLCGASAVFWLFCGSCVLVGAGGGLVDTYANAILIDVHKEDSPRYLGYLHGLFGTGSLLAPLIMMPMLAVAGWRGVFFALSAVFLVGTIILRALGKQAKHTDTERATNEKVLKLADLKEYIRNPRNMFILLITIFATISQTGILSWVLRYMALRFDAENLGNLSISFFWICATINRFSLSRLRVKPIRLMIVGASLAALCLGIGILSGSAWGMFVVMGLFGLCIGHFMQVLFHEAGKGYEGKTTLAMSVVIVVMGITRSIVPLVMAIVSSSLSVEASMMVPAAASIGVAVFGLLLARVKTIVPENL